MFCMTRAERAPEIACDSREQKLYHPNRPLHFHFYLRKVILFGVTIFWFPREHRREISVITSDNGNVLFSK